MRSVRRQRAGGGWSRGGHASAAGMAAAASSDESTSRDDFESRSRYPFFPSLFNRHVAL
jgi:hypothetical protein